MAEVMTYRVPGMTCEHCKRAVSEELSRVRGVESVDVDLDSKAVTVSGVELDDAVLRSAIEESGYEAA
ncbi:MAG: heavy-metal-associated domain-containing protein [Acidimicrobiales bacterium]